MQLREICISTKTTTETLTNAFLACFGYKNGYFMAHPRQCTAVVPVNNIDLVLAIYIDADCTEIQDAYCE